MDRRRIVILFGDSLLMDTLEASLETLNLGVVRIHLNVTDIEDLLPSLDPDLIIFDWDTPVFRFILPFIRHQPGIPLFGLDIVYGKAVAVLSQQHTVGSADDLNDLIRSYTQETLTSEVSC